MFLTGDFFHIWRFVPGKNGPGGYGKPFFCFQQNSLETYRAEKAFAMELKNILFYLFPQYRVQKLEDLEDVSNFIHSARKKNMLVSQQKYLYLLLPILSGSDMVHSQFTEKKYPWENISKKFLAWTLNPK